AVGVVHRTASRKRHRAEAGEVWWRSDTWADTDISIDRGRAGIGDRRPSQHPVGAGVAETGGNLSGCCWGDVKKRDQSESCDQAQPFALHAFSFLFEKEKYVGILHSHRRLRCALLNGQPTGGLI